MMEPSQASALGLRILRHLLPQEALLGVVVFFATLAIDEQCKGTKADDT